MTAFRSIFRMECGRHLRSPLAVLGALLVGVISFHDMSITRPTASGLIRIGMVAHNAPLVVAELLAALAVPSLFLIALLVGPAVQRDIAHRSSAFFFTTPITKLSYLGGRFLGALTAVLLLPAAALTGMVLAWNIIPAEFVTDYRIVGLVQAVLYTVPTLLFLAAWFFAIATLSRTMVSAYTAAVVTMVGLFVVQGIATELLGRGEVSGALVRWVLLFVDLTGSAALADATFGWTAAQRSSALLPLSAAVLWNRVFWSAAALALWGATYRCFSMEHPRFAGSKRESRDPWKDAIAPLNAGSPLTPTVPEWGPRTSVLTFLRRTQIELKSAMGNFVFPVLIGAMVVQLFSNFAGNAKSAGILPRTGFLLNEGLAGIDAPMVVITLFIAGVLVWRERESGEAAITDSLPMSDAVHAGSKFTALMLLQVACAAVVILVGLCIQVGLFGYTDVQPAVYGKGVLGIHLLGWVQIGAAMFLLQVLAPGKRWGFGLCAVAVLWSVIAPLFGLTSPLYRFGSVPSYVYSDMNGFGPFAAPLIGYRALWTAIATVLLGVAVVRWRRGSPATGPPPGLSVSRFLRDHAAAIVTLIAVAVAGLAVLHGGSGGPQQEPGLELSDRLAVYEARYRRFEATPQPTVTSVDVQVDLFPRQREAHIAGSYELVNHTELPTDALHVTLLPNYATAPPAYTLDGSPASVVSADALTGFTVLALNAPLAPGESVILEFDLRVEARSRHDGAGGLALVENGSVVDNFVGNASFFPLIGYRRELEIQDPDVRMEHGLSFDARTLRILGDPEAPLHASRSWVRFSALLSTDDDQTPITTGRLAESWREGGRQHSRFVSDAVMVNEFAVVSGKYRVIRQLVQGVEVLIYYHPGHSGNLERILAGVETGLGYGIDHFGRYPYGSLTIVEVPGYGIVQGTALSKPGMILWNETWGFVNAPSKTGEVDAVFSTAAHECGHQWWGHQVRPAAFLQGNVVLNETLSQYVRLMSLRARFPDAAVRRFLQDEERAYFILRSRSPVGERPLLTTTENFVAYHKGSLAMEALAHHIGEDTLNRALRGLMERFALHGRPFATTLDLVEALRQVSPDSKQYLIEDWFEAITLHDNRIRRADAVRRPDGGWRLFIDADLRKMRSDERGRTREEPFRGEVEIGIYDQAEELVDLRSIPAEEAARTLELLVEQEPVFVILDPSRRLLEPNRDDNFTEVTRVDASDPS